MILRCRVRTYRPGIRACLAAFLSILLLPGLLAWSAPAHGGSDKPVSLRVIGGVGGVAQYRQHEEPFWTTRLPALSGGRITATIRPLDQSSIRAGDMLHLLKLGVVPFGHGLLSVVAADDPKLNALDLPALSPTMADARRLLEAYRPHLRQVLAERYNIELLGVYTYSAQVLFCSKPFRGLDDLAGRKVRAASVGQAELLRALGAIPVQLPFAEIVPAISRGVVECAVTGAMSGVEIGLTRVTSHVHTMALSWGMSFFGANRDAWRALPPDVRELVRTGVASLEADIWAAAEGDVRRGLACCRGEGGCNPDRAGAMTVVQASEADEARRRWLIAQTVLPNWFQRCGSECEAVWAQVLKPAIRIGVDLP